MTKDGRPSRLCDIRYFAGDLHKYLDDHEVSAFGRRIAWWLNGEDISLGSYTALYIFFSPSIAEGAIHVSDYGGDWWQRYTHVGVPRTFPKVFDAKEIATSGTIAALKAIRPDKSELIENAVQTIVDNGEGTRFLIKLKERKDYRIEIAISIGVWPESSYFHVSLIDQATGEFLDAPAVPLEFYDHGFDLAGPVSILKNEVQIKAHPSFTAGLTAKNYKWPLLLPISEFKKLEQRPTISNLVKRNG
ncbi:hypothetical protein [Hyphococcus sp.]|uniref:hypothetical protein n=1 Tax=Hyphococcus sp. TaxID=2038636 RepID=UPI00208C1438|nr:MAG: hypothetical protein DHS20C04_31610 [Marinicaulis sp.]